MCNGCWAYIIQTTLFVSNGSFNTKKTQSISATLYYGSIRVVLGVWWITQAVWDHGNKKFVGIGFFKLDPRTMREIHLRSVKICLCPDEQTPEIRNLHLLSKNYHVIRTFLFIYHELPRGYTSCFLIYGQLQALDVKVALQITKITSLIPETKVVTFFTYISSQLDIFLPTTRLKHWKCCWDKPPIWWE